MAAGGAAARLQATGAWAASPQGRAARAQPPVAVERTGDGPPGGPGVRVRGLDLTRVIAGPPATTLLAAHGADVLRLEPPGFTEVPVLTVDTGFGKRSARLDLRDPAGRSAFEDLVRAADVVVTGFRPGALAALGYGEERMAELRPGVVTASLSGWGGGPWGRPAGLRQPRPAGERHRRRRPGGGRGRPADAAAAPAARPRHRPPPGARGAPGPPGPPPPGRHVGGAGVAGRHRRLAGGPRPGRRPGGAGTGSRHGRPPPGRAAEPLGPPPLRPPGGGDRRAAARVGPGARAARLVAGELVTHAGLDPRPRG